MLEVVLWHHEFLDGSGYPDGLAGTKIPDLVRLATICDIYSALIERRPYRPPLGPAEAFEILQRMEGKVEGALVRAFANIARQSAAALPDRSVRATLAGKAKVRSVKVDRHYQAGSTPT